MILFIKREKFIALMKLFICILVLLLALRVANVSGQTPGSNYSLSDMQQYEIHQVVKGETLYSLSKTYHTDIKTITDLNPQIVNNNLKIGSSIKLPKINTSSKTVSKDTYTGIGPKPFLIPIKYSVVKGETLYAISKKTNNDLEAIKLWNDLKNDNIKPGQDLIVGYVDGSITKIENTDTEVNKVEPKPVVSNTTKETKTSPKTDTNIKDSSVKKDVPKDQVLSNTTKKSTTNTIDNTSKDNSISKPTVKITDVKNEKLIYIVNKGLCTYTRGNSDNGNKYCLHATAPIGSTISVKNMMNNKSVQVKVIGRLPLTPEYEKIEIKISGSAAKEISVVDEKVLVQVSYMGYESDIKK